MIRRPPRSTLSLHDALPIWEVEHDRDREQIVLAGESDQRLARLALDVGRVDHRESPGCEPARRDEVQDRERILRRGLVVLRSEEHTSELQSRQYLVCRLLLE